MPGKCFTAAKQWNVYNYYYPKYDLSYAHCLYVTNQKIGVRERAPVGLHSAQTSLIFSRQEMMPKAGRKNPWKRRVNSARRSFTFPVDLERDESLYYFPRFDFSFHPFPVCRMNPAVGSSLPVDVVLEGDHENEEELEENFPDDKKFSGKLEDDARLSLKRGDQDTEFSQSQESPDSKSFKFLFSKNKSGKRLAKKLDGQVGLSRKQSPNQIIGSRSVNTRHPRSQKTSEATKSSNKIAALASRSKLNAPELAQSVTDTTGKSTQRSKISIGRKCSGKTYVKGEPFEKVENSLCNSRRSPSCTSSRIKSETVARKKESNKNPVTKTPNISKKEPSEASIRKSCKGVTTKVFKSNRNHDFLATKGVEQIDSELENLSLPSKSTGTIKVPCTANTDTASKSLGAKNALEVPAPPSTSHGMLRGSKGTSQPTPERVRRDADMDHQGRPTLRSTRKRPPTAKLVSTPAELGSEKRNPTYNQSAADRSLSKFSSNSPVKSDQNCRTESRSSYRREHFAVSSQSSSPTRRCFWTQKTYQSIRENRIAKYNEFLQNTLLLLRKRLHIGASKKTMPFVD